MVCEPIMLESELNWRNGDDFIWPPVNRRFFRKSPPVFSFPSVKLHWRCKISNRTTLKQELLCNLFKNYKVKNYVAFWDPGIHSEASWKIVILGPLLFLIVSFHSHALQPASNLSPTKPNHKISPSLLCMQKVSTALSTTVWTTRGSSWKQAPAPCWPPCTAHK